MVSIWSLILIQIYVIQLNIALDYVKPCMNSENYENQIVMYMSKHLF